MKQSLSKKEKELYKRISRILWEKWDPIGVYNSENEWDDEYDGYVPSIFNLVVADRDSHKISQHLVELERVSMGLGTQEINNQHLSVANLIVNAKNEILGKNT